MDREKRNPPNAKRKKGQISETEEENLLQEVAKIL
jgi:hypothetical protein